MAEKHLDALFSAAYDDDLDPAARRRFDAHVGACARCEEAWDDYRAALDAVRALPAVAMPADVRLPVGPPQVEAGRAAFLGRLRSALLRPQPVGAAAGLAAVSLALVVLAVHHPGGGTATNASNGVAYGAAEGRGAAQAPAMAPAPGLPGMEQNHAPQALSVVACPVYPAPGSTGPPQPGYSHSTQTSVAGGRTFVLATASDTYAPGETVPVYARLTGGGTSPGGADVVPCVTLETAGSTAAGSAAAPVPKSAPATPIAVATAQPESSGGVAASGARSSSAGQLRVTIPTSVPHGSTLRLVALIPAASSPTGQQLEIELLITVS